MFDLERAIAAWRRQMLDARVKNPTTLDELESHLREDVERQVRSGVSAEEAFEMAAQRIGQPDSLQKEFAKTGGTVQERIKRAAFTLVGVPNFQLVPNMNISNSNIEPGWATYIKAAAFIAPAVCLWNLSMLYCVPQIKALGDRAGGIVLPELCRFSLGITYLIWDHWIYPVGAGVLALVFLERRTSNWPRYRRAAASLAVFILNFAFLVSLFLIIVTAAFVAGTANQRPK